MAEIYDFSTRERISAEQVEKPPPEEYNDVLRHIDLLNQFKSQIKNMIYCIELINDRIPLAGSSCIIDRDEVYLMNCLNKDLMSGEVIIIEPEEPNDETGD